MDQFNDYNIVKKYKALCCTYEVFCGWGHEPWLTFALAVYWLSAF